MVPVICIYIKLGLIYLTSGSIYLKFGPIYLKFGPIYLTSGPIYLKFGPIYLTSDHIYVGMASSEASEASELWERESASTSTRVLFRYFTQIGSRAQTSDQASFRLLHPHQFAGSNRLLHPHQRPGSHQPCGSCFKPTSTPQWLLNLNGYKSSIVVRGSGGCYIARMRKVVVVAILQECVR